MCGIVGFTHGFSGSGAHPAEASHVLNAMLQSIRHRGPDALAGWHSPRLSLGFARLAILDLEQGDQPVVYEGGQIVSVFNGEIYNHRDLRKDLESKGYVFQSDHSDAELIPALYHAYGEDFPNHLNGMFAIAVYDAKQQSLMLIRDRAGIKPLYYAEAQGELIFASELKGLFKHPCIRKAPNPEALYHYFSFKNTPAPLTAFEGIFQLKPGEMLIKTSGCVRRRQWWSLNAVERAFSFCEAALQLRSLLEDSVRLQYQADVEVGAYLSGGVDSSSVVALMSRLSSKPLKTFTLVYDEQFDRKDQDRLSAQLISKQYGTEHYECLMTEQRFWNELQEINDCFDEPFSGVTSTYFLSELISRHVKVAVSGDGADELFGSYFAHRLAQPLVEFSRLTPAQRLQWQHREFTADYLSSLDKISGATEQRMQLMLWHDDAKQSLFTHGFKARVQGVRTASWLSQIDAEFKGEDSLNRTLFLDFHTLLPDQVLAFVDRLSMAHSLEVRPAFLDHRLIELAFSISGSHKIAHGDVKRVLKEAVKDLLPESILQRPKEGFVLPVNFWLQRDRFRMIPELLNEQVIRQSDVLEWSQVQHTQAQALNGNTKAQMQLWNIMMFCVWWRRHFG